MKKKMILDSKYVYDPKNENLSEEDQQETEKNSCCSSADVHELQGSSQSCSAAKPDSCSS